ncbi:hypothetical protein J4225_03420 [Candidatus Pacearchaeota archaeon]|nr:hypothetical protein [Candidatus Pacearchaeota archaeon]
MQPSKIERILSGTCAALSITLIGLSYLFDNNSLHPMASVYLAGSLAFYSMSKIDEDLYLNNQVNKGR